MKLLPRRFCERVLSSRLAIITASLAFCVLVDKSHSSWSVGSAPAAAADRDSRAADAAELLPPPPPPPGMHSYDLPSKVEAAAAWFAKRKLDVSKKKADDAVQQQPPPGTKPRLAQLVQASPLYAINATSIEACAPPPPQREVAGGAEAAAATATTAARSPPLVLIWVYSAPANVEARARVRGTWGSVTHCEGFAIRVLFFVGLRSPGLALVEDRQLVDENSAHGDIVQDVSYVDSYENLSLKGASGLRWLSRYCSGGAFAVKVDDDTLVSPFALARYLRSADLTRDIACKLQVRVRPQRKPDKWFEDPLDFPDRLYPLYCQGFAYIMPMKIAQLLEGAVGKTRVPRMEDVYVTGVLAQFAGAGHTALPKEAWLLIFPKGFEWAVDDQTNVIFVSDTFVPSRVDYFWQKQKRMYNWKA